MDTPRERWREVERLADAALDLSAGERAVFLDRSCSGDTALRREVERLVRASERAEDPLEVDATNLSATAELRDRLQAALGAAYSIESELGGAGMSRVFVAVETALERRVVIKVLPPEFTAGVSVERFRREIRLAASLQHPHIVPVLQAGQARDLLYYTMPFVEGESLRARLAREGRLPVADVVRLLSDIVDALAYAHGQGIVHRDLKPGNVLLSRAHAMVVDFGVAKALRTAGGAGDGALTVAGHILGTPAYMAPEQVAGDPATDHRADLYALGVLAYEMLAGSPPFAGDSPHELMAAHLADTPEPLTRQRADVPTRLAKVVMHCLEKRPADRPQSAEEVLRELETTTSAPAPLTRRASASLEKVAQAVASATSSPRRRKVAVGTALVLLAAGVGAALLSADRSSAELTPGRAVRLTVEPGLELDPVLSPDGALVAYAADVGGRMQLYIKQVIGERAVPITSDLPGYHRWPRWSPDGSRIAFQAGGSIYVVPAFGGPPRPLVTPPLGQWAAYPAWSPDGRQIAYVENDVIFTRLVDGGTPRVVARSTAAHSLAWSPDGQWIAFVSGNWRFIFGSLPWGAPANVINVGPSSIWVVRARGGVPVRVTDETSLNVSPAWLPDSRGLLFVSNREGSRDVYRVSLDRSGSPSAPPTRLTTGLDAHTIDLSADARRLVYSVFTYSSNVWSIRIPERGPVSVSEAEPVTAGNQTIEAVALSPDGQWLAFDSDRSGNQDIYKMPVGGGEPVRLTTHPGDDFMSSWSPNGREIAFAEYDSGTRLVKVMSAEGGTPRTVTKHPPGQGFPGWSPDGKSLVFHSGASGRIQLYVVSRRADSSWSEARQLTRDGGVRGRWSPDGRQIVYSNDDGVWLISPSGGEPRPLVRIENRSSQPIPDIVQWSPDGKTVYYQALDSQGHTSFWSVPATGGTPKLLVRFDDPSRQSNRPEFTTDGKRFYFTIGQRESDVWTMELTAQR